MAPGKIKRDNTAPVPNISLELSKGQLVSLAQPFCLPRVLLRCRCDISRIHRERLRMTGLAFIWDRQASSELAEVSGEGWALEPPGLGVHRTAVLPWSDLLRPAGTPAPFEITETHILLLFPVVYSLPSSLPRHRDDCLKTNPMMCLTSVSLQKAKYEANILTSLSVSFLKCVSQAVTVKQS